MAKINENFEIGDSKKTLNNLITYTRLNVNLNNGSDYTNSIIKTARYVVCYYLVNGTDYCGSIIIYNPAVPWWFEVKVDNGESGFIHVKFDDGYVQTSDISSPKFKLLCIDVFN